MRDHELLRYSQDENNRVSSGITGQVSSATTSTLITTLTACGCQPGSNRWQDGEQRRGERQHAEEGDHGHLELRGLAARGAPGSVNQPPSPPCSSI